MKKSKLKEQYQEILNVFESKVPYVFPNDLYICDIICDLYGNNSDIFAHFKNELKNSCNLHNDIYQTIIKRYSIWDVNAPFYPREVKLRRQLLNEIIKSLS